MKKTKEKELKKIQNNNNLLKLIMVVNLKSKKLKQESKKIRLEEKEIKKQRLLLFHLNSMV